MGYCLGGDVDHTFLPDGLFAFSSTVFRAGTTGKAYFHDFGFFSGGETERGGTHQGYGGRVEQIGGMQEAGIATDDKVRLLH